MQTSGFEVALFPYESIVVAFGSIGIDARFDEGTSDLVFQQTIDQIESLSAAKRKKFKNHLVRSNQELLNQFFAELQATLDRHIEQIILIPLHGQKNEFGNVADAIIFVNAYREDALREGGFREYEIIVRYSNGDKIEASFHNKEKTVGFLQYIEEGARA